MDDNKDTVQTNTSIKKLELLMKDNAELIRENNKILKKIHRNGMWGLWVRIAWYTILIGLPFALYFYVLEPYFTALGSDFEIFRAGINEIPGLKSFNAVIGSGESGT
ncbi:hypothetical protein N9L26_00950 [Candidatus Pacebacteria bacterium]|nr:hypothetical protein [Candidatus Paceibacterota bacterium]